MACRRFPKRHTSSLKPAILKSVGKPPPSKLWANNMHPRYQEWLTYVFDHPATDPRWYFEPDSPEFLGSESDFARLIAQTFLRSGEDLKRFYAQVDQGIWFLASPTGSSLIHSLRDGQASLIEKLTGIHNIFCLYRDCFAARCAETLGHKDEPGGRRTCIPFAICSGTFVRSRAWKTSQTGRTSRRRFFACLRELSQIEHRACREGNCMALDTWPANFRRKLAMWWSDSFATATLDAALRRYAEKTRGGNAL